VSDFVQNNSEIYQEFGDIKKISENIRKEGFYAQYEFVKFTADCLQKPIYLYKNNFDERNLDIIFNDFGNCN